MKATALAAGKGTRLFPLTGEMAKPLVPALDKPIIQHVFDLLATQGVEVVNVRHSADAILGLCGEGSRVDGMTVTFSREEELMVTAGGVTRLVDTIQLTRSSTCSSSPRYSNTCPRTGLRPCSGPVPQPTLATGAKLTGCERALYWSDIGTLEAYRTAEQDVFAGRLRIKIPGATLDAREPGNLWDCRGARAPPHRHFV